MIVTSPSSASIAAMVSIQSREEDPGASSRGMGLGRVSSLSSPERESRWSRSKAEVLRRLTFTVRIVYVKECGE